MIEQLKDCFVMPGKLKVLPLSEAHVARDWVLASTQSVVVARLYALALLDSVGQLSKPAPVSNTN